MNVCLISFEFPPAVAVGGIGTYAHEAALMLVAAGHPVDVFAAGTAPGLENPAPGLRVHRVVAKDRRSFARALVPPLLDLHRSHPFDLIEAPEIGPEGAEAFAALPDVARVVKLHTPAYLVARSGHEPPGVSTRLRFLLGALKRGRFATLPSIPSYDPARDPEYHAARMADLVVAPSRAIAEVVGHDWQLPPDRVLVHPYPFRPAPSLIALDPPRELRTVGFLGRLEPRKGILEICEAIPKILRACPGLSFRFIGPSWPFHGSDMRTWMESRLRRHAGALEFAGAVAPSGLAAELARCDAIILPSRWENFPFACWESLAAARAVIGSAAGGMAEVIENGVSGLLIPPRNPTAIRDAVLTLARDPASLRRFAVAGRERVRDLLAPERVLPLHLEGYHRALRLAAARRATPQSLSSPDSHRSETPTGDAHPPRRM